MTGRKRTKAKGLVDRLKNGESFAELAKQQSEDTQTAPQGGDLGWLKATELAPELRKAIIDLVPGEISNPIDGIDGVVIVIIGRAPRGARGLKPR